jgi:hypothetical protein
MLFCIKVLWIKVFEVSNIFLETFNDFFEGSTDISSINQGLNNYKSRKDKRYICTSDLLASITGSVEFPACRRSELVQGCGMTR